MGRGDKKSAKGKRTIGSFGNTRSRKKIKARLARVASVKKTASVSDAKPKAKRVVKKKESAE